MKKIDIRDLLDQSQIKIDDDGYAFHLGGKHNQKDHGRGGASPAEEDMASRLNGSLPLDDDNPEHMRLRGSIRAYTGSSEKSHEMRVEMRAAADDPTMNTDAAQLMRVTAAAPPTAPPLYRGTAGVDPERVPRKGAVISMGPSSFSAKESVADSFATSRASSTGRPTAMKVKLKKKSRSLKLEGEAEEKFADEQEYLTMGKFKVTSFRESTVTVPAVGGGTTQVQLFTLEIEQVPDTVDVTFTRVLDRIRYLGDNAWDPLWTASFAELRETRGQALTAASSAGLSPQDVSTMTDLWQDEIDGVLTPLVAETYTGSAVNVAVGLADGFPSTVLPGVPLLPDDFTQTFLKTVVGDFVSVGDDVWEDTREILIQGVKRGESIEQIAAKMRYVTEFSQRRATEIARTVTHAAAESGSIAQLRFLGYSDDEVVKEWSATHDLRTRPNHKAADGQTIPINERFQVGATTLDFPGDPSGSRAETRNCRCTVYFHIDDAPKLRCDGALIAAATSTHCVIPTPNPAATLTPGQQAAINLGWQGVKVTPAYGGAAIHKALAELRQKLKTYGHHDADNWDDYTILAQLDSAFPSKGAFTYSSKYAAWAQTSAGQKAGAKLPGAAPTHAVTPTTSTTATPVPTVPTPTLPAVAPKPYPSEITFTGQTLGSHGAQVWINPATGQKWLFKPQQKFMTDLDVAIARIQSKGAVQRPGVYAIELNGQKGSIQYMFDATDAWPHGSFQPTTLTAAEIRVLQQEQIFDWMISNHDTHSGQWIRLSGGEIYGTDKGQAFKFFGNDKLDWDYIPVTPLGSDKLTYSAMWKAFINGDIDLEDPTMGPLGEYMARLMAIPDAEYRQLLLPYAQWRAAHVGGTVDSFLDAAVKRKNDLRDEFAVFWARAVDERNQHVTPFAPTTTAPAPVAAPAPLPTPALLTSTDISHLSWTQKVIIRNKFKEANGGTIVTPAWGGSKIWKVLQDAKTKIDSEPGLPPLSEMQILKALDEVGGTSEPKSYVTVLTKWLDGPGKNKVPNPPPSLIAPPPAVTTPVMSPLPTSASGLTELMDAYANGLTATPANVYAGLQHFPAGTILGYSSKGAQSYRIKKFSDTSVQIEELQPDGTWKVIAQEPSPLQFTSKYGSTIHQSPGGVVAPSAPLAPPIPSKIPGKAPGDLVNSSEIEASRWLWSADEVVGTGKPDSTGGFMSLISDGHGGFDAKYTAGSHGASWVVKHYSSTKHLPKTIYTIKEWKLSGSAITPSVPSPATVSSALGGSIHAGDVITDVVQIKNGPGSTTDVVQLAYAYSSHNATEYRVMYSFGVTKIQYRTATSTHWDDLYTTFDGQVFDDFFKQLTWYAAKTNGDAPDAYKATLPGPGGPTTALTPSNVPGISDGDTVTPVEIINTIGAPKMVLATGKSSVGTEYRIVVASDGSKVVQGKNIHGEWKNSSTFQADVPGNLPPVTGWIASSEKLTASVTHTATPPTPSFHSVLYGTQTHFPGKSVGDQASGDEIWNTWTSYAEGQVIAEKTNWQGTFRIFVAHGHLVMQKQNVNGQWVGTKLVTNKWGLPSQNGWVLKNDLLPAPKLKAAQKFVDKKVNPPTPTGGGFGTPTTTPPSPGAPYVPQPIDMSMWSPADEDIIYRALTNKNIGSTSFSSSEVFDRIQAVINDLASSDSRYAQLSIITMLRIYDAKRAAHHGVTNTNKLESKIVTWLGTPAGRIHAGKKINAPVAAVDVPRPMHALDDPTNPHPDTQTYQTISNSGLVAERGDSHARYGAWPANQKSALRSYTGGVYSSWNAAIRLGDLGRYKSQIRAAQAGMRPSTKPMLLHRKASYAEFNDPSISSIGDLQARVGQRFVTRGFSSTSNNPGGWSGNVHFEIECPIGTPMARVQDFSHYPSENETILAAHLIYEIRSVTAGTYGTTVRVRVVGAYDPAVGSWS